MRTLFFSDSQYGTDDVKSYLAEITEMDFTILDASTYDIATIAKKIAETYAEEEIGLIGMGNGGNIAFQAANILCETYHKRPHFLVLLGGIPDTNSDKKLNVPIGVLYGSADNIDAEQMQSWCHHTDCFLGAVQLFGKSAELYENREQTIAAIRKHMRNGVYSDIRNLQDLLENNTMVYEKKTFIQYKENGELATKTFREFRCDVNAFSHYLAEIGAENKHISILGDTSWQFFTAFYAALVVPAVITAIDNKFSAAEICDIFVRSDAEYVIYQKEYANKVTEAVTASGRAIRMICMDEMPGILSSYPVTPRKTQIDIDAPVALLYTSGTTGKSKGVLLSSRNILENLGAVQAESFWNAENTSFLSTLPNYHIYCLTVDFLCSVVCGTTVSVSDLRNLISDVSFFKATRIMAVPMMLKYILYYLRTAEKKMQCSKEEVKRRLFWDGFIGVTSSAAFLEDALKEAISEYGIEVTQGYGMTECTSHIATDSISGYRPGSVGKVIKGMQIRIVDHEIWVKGPGVMLGYYKDEAATAEVIEDGWLKTGDLGYMDEDGWLYITGRKKNLIILSNGENVLPEELELQIERCEYVSEVLVIGKNDVLTAEIYPESAYVEKLGLATVKAEIEAYIETCNKTLVSYKQIHRVVMRETPFEKTNSRKIKRFLYQS